MKRFLNFIKNKKSVSAICMALCLVLGVIYVAAHLVGGFSAKLTIAPAIIASETEYELYDAYIFRDENVISSRYSGYRHDLLDDGEMAGIGTEFARVYENAADGEMAGELELIDKTVELLRTAGVKLGSSGIDAARRTLKDGYVAVTELLSGGDVLGASKYKGSIVNVLSMLAVNTGSRDQVEANLAGLDAEIERLESEKAARLASLGAEYESLTTDKTGYYYSGTDGFEVAMSTEGIEEKTLAQFFESIESLSVASDTSPNEAGRMVYDPHWYAAVPVDMGIAVKYLDADGDPKYGPYSVDFYDGEWKREQLTLERVVLSPEDSRAILLFSSSVMDIGFSGGRERRIRILTDELEGLRVPTEALRESEGETGVFILTYGTVEWRRVEIIYRAENYVLVRRDAEGAYLALNDSMIVGGQELYDGKTVD